MDYTMKETKVTVIGGGIMGLSSTYHLAKEGVDVVLVEMKKIAAGSSGANAGVIRKGDSVDSTDDIIYKKSFEMYQDWNRTNELGIDIEMKEISVLRCFKDEHIEKSGSGLWKRRFDNWNKEKLSPRRRKEWNITEPNLAEDIKWGIETSGTMINIFRVCNGLSFAAKKYNAEILTNTEVKDIDLINNKVQKIVTDRGEIKTDIIVDAAGAWAPHIGRMVGIDIPVLPAIGTALVTEPIPSFTNHKRIIYDPIWFNPDQPFNNNSQDQFQKLGITTEIDRHEEEGNYLIGRSEHIVTLPRKTAKIPIEPETIKRISKSAIQVLPKIKDIHVIRAYAGTRPVCEVDGKPIVGKVEDREGFIIASGLWHTGMSYGPMCGKLVSEIIVHDKTTIPITKFELSRFTDKDHFPYVHQFRNT